MQIQISLADGVPIYQQIVNQVRYLIGAARLEPGEELLPIRILAEQLTVNPNTVARAYLELERAGLVTKRHGSGTYVSAARNPLPPREKLRILWPRVDTLLSEARQLDVGLAEIMKLVRERNALMREETEK